MKSIKISQVTLFFVSAVLASSATLPVAADSPVFALPGAPTSVRVEPAEGGFQVSWSAPQSDGNSQITNYVVDGGLGTCVTTVVGDQRTAFIPAIDTKQASFRVWAVNSQGFGAASSETTTVSPGVARSGLISVDWRGRVSSIGTTLPSLISRLGAGFSKFFGTVTTPSGKGAWLLTTGNRVLTLGDASVQAFSFADNATQIIPSFDGKGFHLIGRKGLVYNSPQAPTISSSLLDKYLIVGGAATASGKGIWLVATSGKIFGLGDATSATLPKGNYVRVVPRATGEGFWAITREGKIQAFGDAPQLTAVLPSFKDIAQASNGKGFYALLNDGSVINVGDVAPLAVNKLPKSVALINLAKISEVKDVAINAFSDFHGALDYSKSTVGGRDVYTSGSAVMASIFASDRNLLPATFTLSSGDNWGAAPPLSTVFDEIPSVEALNFMGLDVSTFGNHEHDKPLSHVNRTIAASNFKWVVSNYSSLGELSATNTEGVKTQPWVVIERGGFKLGVVGLNTPETKDVIFPGNLGQISIGDVLATDSAGASAKRQVLSAISEARKAGADLVVTLAHEGFAQFNSQTGLAEGRLIDMSRVLSGSDLVLGGHSHLKYGGIIDNKLVAETTNAGALVNKVHVCVDTATRRTIGSRVEHVVPQVSAVAGTALAATPLNQSALASISDYKANLSTKYNQVIGTIADVAANGGSPQVQRNYETGLGNYIADKLRAAMGTDIAIINGGGIRDMLPAKAWVPTDTSIVRPSWTSLQAGYTTSNGPWKVTSSGPYTLTVGDVATVLPFGNSAATTRITGADVWAALENGVSQISLGAGRFPQVSGLKFTFDMSKAANSGRVTEVTLTDGTPIPNSTAVTYSLATNDFMVSGGDGYTMFGGLAKAKTRDVLETLIREAITRDSQSGPVVMTTDGRITRVGG